MITLLYIGIGGFLGANARYILSTWITQWLGEHLGWNVPLGTAFVNITGSVFLAMFALWVSNRLYISDNFRLLITTGFFGAYTTFSTYANESINLLGKDWRLGVSYILATNVLCLVGVVIGLCIGSQLGLSD